MAKHFATINSTTTLKRYGVHTKAISDKLMFDQYCWLRYEQLKSPGSPLPVCCSMLSMMHSKFMTSVQSIAVAAAVAVRKNNLHSVYLCWYSSHRWHSGRRKRIAAFSTVAILWHCPDNKTPKRKPSTTARVCIVIYIGATFTS